MGGRPGFLIWVFRNPRICYVFNIFLKNYNIKFILYYSLNQTGKYYIYILNKGVVIFNLSNFQNTRLLFSFSLWAMSSRNTGGKGLGPSREVGY